MEMLEAVEEMVETESKLAVMEPPTMVRAGNMVHHHLSLDDDDLCS